jgi:hypothetical protein
MRVDRLCGVGVRVSGYRSIGSGSIRVFFYKLRVFEIRVLRRTLDPKRDEVGGSCMKLHIHELHNLNSSPNVIRITNPKVIGREGNVARIARVGGGGVGKLV